MTTEPRVQEDRLGALESQVGELAQAVARLTKSVEEDRQARAIQEAKAQRASRITSLCALVNLDSQKAAECITIESLSVEDVHYDLLKLKLDRSQAPEQEALSDQEQLEARLAQEFDQHLAIHRQTRVSREAYIRHYQEDPMAPELMSPEWAEHYCQQAAEEDGLAV